MHSIRSLVIIWLLKHRHFFKLKLKPEVVDEDFSYINFREGIERGAAKLNKDYEDIKIIKEDIEGINGEWLIPKNAPDDKALLYIHGGGFISGSSFSHRMHVSKFVRNTSIKALVFDYRLAPENPFPAALNDSMKVYEWLLNSGYKPSSIIFAGESAGGSLVLSTLVALRDKKIPRPKAAVSISPCTDLSHSAPSYKDNIHNDIAIIDSWKYWFPMYYGENDPSHPWISPLNADLKELPPTLIFVGSNEVHFDDSRNFAQKAIQAGVDVNFKVWEGMIHAFPLLSPMFPEAKQAMDEICTYINNKINN